MSKKPKKLKGWRRAKFSKTGKCSGKTVTRGRSRRKVCYVKKGKR